MGDPAVIRFWENTQDEHPINLYVRNGRGITEHLATALRLRPVLSEDHPPYATLTAIQCILKETKTELLAIDSGLFVGAWQRGNGVLLNVNWGSKTVWNDDWRVSFNQYINGEWKALQSG